MPVGLEDVSKYPALFAELIKRGYSDNDVMKVARLNIVRVFEAVEKVSESVVQRTTAKLFTKCHHHFQIRDELRDQLPDNTHISPQPNVTCRPNF